MMISNVSLHFYFFLCLSIIYLLVEQCHGIPTIPYPQSSQIERIPSIINRGKEIVNRLRCSKGWKRFGSSCYYPSIIRSTPHTANQTCHHLPANNSHLMYIRRTIEFSYAAHLFLTNNLTSLLVQTDPQLFQNKPYLNVISADDRASWKAIADKLYQARLKSEQDDNQNQTIYASDDDDEKDDSQWFDRIGNLCQGLEWNVKKNDSRLFSFTAYKVSNTVACELTDADPNSTYEHTCQYVLNFCFGSLLCKHGECVSGLSNFKCLCDWFFEGDRCEKVSRRIIEAVVAVLVCFVIGLVRLIMKIHKKIKLLKSWIKSKIAMDNDQTNLAPTDTRLLNQPIMTNGRPAEPREPKKGLRICFVPAVGLVFLCLLLSIPAVKQYYSYPLRGIDITNSESMIDKATSLLQTCKRKPLDSPEGWIFPGISLVLTFLFISLLKYQSKNKPSSSPTSDRGNSPRSALNPDQTDRDGNLNGEIVPLLDHPSSLTTTRENQLDIDESTRPKSTCRQQDDNDRQNTVYINHSHHHPSDTLFPRAAVRNEALDEVIGADTGSSGFPTQELPTDQAIHFEAAEPAAPIDPRKRTDRAETAAILAILTFEILKVLDDLLLTVGGSSEDGVLTTLAKQILVVLIIGLRYYPIFISLNCKDKEVKSVALCIIRFLTFVYVLGIIGYTIYREGVCFDFIPHSENFTLRDEVLLRIKLGTWFTVFGLIVNVPHFLFLSYIGGEFGRRLIFGSYRKEKKDHRRDNAPLSTEELETLHRNRTDHRSCFTKLCDTIYQPHEKFHYGVLSMSMYTVNFVILWHLASSFIFLYTTRTMSPISFLTNTLQQRLNIEIKDTLFHPEIFICAVVTALIYTFQLFRGMAYLRQDIIRYPYEQRSVLEAERDLNILEAPGKATKYPGYLIRYTVGGYVITFHLLFFVFIQPRLIIRHSSVLKYIPNVFIFILILYVLQYVIAKIISKLISHRKQKKSKVVHIGQQSNPQNISAGGVNNTSTPDHRSSCTGCSACRRPRLGVSGKSIVQYFLLVANCFIGVAASIFRLLLILLINIVSINRVESSPFADPFKELDSPNTAYWHFVYQEICAREPETQNPPAAPPSQSRSSDQRLEQNQHQFETQISQEAGLDDQQPTSNRNRVTFSTNFQSTDV